MSLISSVPTVIEYPDSDGKPMSDNTKQARWIVLFYTNLQTLFIDRDDVFVAADLLWYPVKGDNKKRQAPDVMVAFGRPKGDRGSYKQWEENGVPVTVAFEVLSPGNDQEEMTRKHEFYEEHGVEEYYIYDPDTNQLTAWKRGKLGAAFVRVRKVNGHVSPRLGIRFDLSGPEMEVFGPDGQRFVTLDEERTRRIAAERRVARLVELVRKLRQGAASPAEIAEIERLEAEALTPDP